MLWFHICRARSSARAEPIVLYARAAASATVLVAASVIVTSLLVPVPTAWWAGRVGRTATGE